MARIRSIKPEFFRHHGLYELEQETGLPIRVAFAGLWTVADREGRFKWKIPELKLDCLPFDDVDFSRVLHALATRGYVCKYTHDTREYGWIPRFIDHQVINNKESASVLPPPPQDTDSDDDLTRASRVAHACPTPLNLDQGEGKGREGKGRDIGTASAAPDKRTKSSRGSRTVPESWQPKPKTLTDLAEKFPALDVTDQLDRMRLHEYPKPILDFDRAFRRWCIKADEFRQRDGGAAGANPIRRPHKIPKDTGKW